MTDAIVASPREPALPPAPWHLYLLECKGRRLYAGITNRLLERLEAHAAGTGAKFTRAFPPVRLIGSRRFADRSEASKAEYAIKQMARARKLAYIQEATA